MGYNEILINCHDFEEKGYIKAEYLYLNGGKDTLDKPCIDWGSANISKFRIIGDNAGSLRISYNNGIVDYIPLIYGYSIWWEKLWKDTREPFDSDADAAQLLKSTLYLKNAFEAQYPYTLRIKLRDIPIVRIELFDNLQKDGAPQIPKYRFANITEGIKSVEEISSDFNIDDPEQFFNSHTIDSFNPYPEHIKENIESIRMLLYTFGSDFSLADEINAPEDFRGTSIKFFGGNEANILSSVFHHNIIEVLGRVDKDGLVNESGADNEEWFYDGFGTWKKDCHQYHGKYYTRNRTVQLLAKLNHIEKCNKALSYLDKALMFFPENFPKFQLNGERIPGHWTVVANDPLWYSRELTAFNWPTQYTKENFGEHYADFGNPETDGHGLSMAAHWSTWNKEGRPKEWVEERWTVIYEAAYFLLWALDNSELSFSKFGLLYGETEAAMSEYTMYANVPCYIGLRMYAEMADAIGKNDIAETWRSHAEGLKDAIDKFFGSYDSKYKEIWEREGWPATLGLYVDYFGYDVLDKLPKEWVKRYRNTFKKNLAEQTDRGFASGGLGYYHNAYLQTALLLDNMSVAELWIKNLSKLCFAPRLPRTYIVPECMSIDIDKMVIVRLGDIGNLVHMTETLHSILIMAGIDDTDPTELKIMPRLPQAWNLNVGSYPVRVEDDGSKIVELSLCIQYPKDGEQKANLCTISDNLIKNAKLRFGPFSADVKSVEVVKADKVCTAECFESGDSSWVWVDTGVISKNNVEINVRYRTCDKSPRG